MGTRSTIIQKLDNGKYRSIYCHWDGYLSNNGRILLNYYKDPEKVSKLMELGSLSSLKREVDIPDGATHSHDIQHEGITVSYFRDRSEDWKNVKYLDKDTLKKSMDEFYTYVYFDGDWYVTKELIMRNYNEVDTGDGAENYVHLISNIINVEGIELVLLSDFESVLGK